MGLVNMYVIVYNAVTNLAHVHLCTTECVKSSNNYSGTSVRTMHHRRYTFSLICFFARSDMLASTHVGCARIIVLCWHGKGHH